MHNNTFMYLQNNIPFPIYIFFVAMSFYLNKYIGLMSIGILLLWMQKQKVCIEGYTVKMKDGDTCCHCQKCSTMKSAFNSDVLSKKKTDDNKKDEDKDKDNDNDIDKNKKSANIDTDIGEKVDGIGEYVSNADKATLPGF